MSVRYRWWHKLWDKMQNRKVIEMKPEGFTVLCIACLEPLDTNTSTKDTWKTFSLGTSEKSCFAFGIIPLCEEHRELQNPIDVLLWRSVQLHQTRISHVGS